MGEYILGLITGMFLTAVIDIVVNYIIYKHKDDWRTRRKYMSWFISFGITIGTLSIVILIEQLLEKHENVLICLSTIFCIALATFLFHAVIFG